MIKEETLSIVLPYLFVVGIATPFYLLLKRGISSFLELKYKELSLIGKSHSLQHSYIQRMITFLDRIQPSFLVNRFSQEISPAEFIFLTEKAIAQELDFNSNIKEYLSESCWTGILEAVDQIKSLLHSTYEGMAENASLIDYKSLFLIAYLGQPDLNHHARHLLHQEKITTK